MICGSCKERFVARAECRPSDRSEVEKALSGIAKLIAEHGPIYVPCFVRLEHELQLIDEFERSHARALEMARSNG